MCAAQTSHDTWSDFQCYRNPQEETLRKRIQASKQEFFNKSDLRHEMHREQTSRALYEHEIDLTMCKFYDVDSQGSLIYIIDTQDKFSSMHEIAYEEIPCLQEHREWCRVGERYYEKRFEPYYERHKSNLGKICRRCWFGPLLSHSVLAALVSMVAWLVYREFCA